MAEGVNSSSLDQPAGRRDGAPTAKHIKEAKRKFDQNDCIRDSHGICIVVLGNAFPIFI